MKSFFIKHFYWKTAGLNLLVISFTIFIVRKFFSQPFAYSDFVPFSFDYQATLDRFLFLWTPSFFGYFEPKGISYLFRAFFEFLSFGNPSVAQGMFLTFFFLVAYYGVFIFLKRMRVSRVVNYLMPFCFFINPVIAVEVSNGAIGILALYSLIPYLVLMTTDLLIKYKFSSGFFLSLIIGVYLLNPQSAFWILIWMPLLVFFYFLLHKDLSHKISFEQIKRLFQLAGHVILGIVLNIAFIFNFSTISNNFMNISYLADFRNNYKEATFGNLFRLIGNNGSPQAHLGYFDINFFNIGAFIFPIIIIFYFILKRNNYKTYIQYFLITAILLSMFFMVIVRMGYLDSLIIAKNAFLTSARNPQKIFYFFSFAYVILLSLSVDKIYIFITKYSKEAAYLLLFFLTFLYLGWNKPVLTGDFSLSKTRKENNYIVEDKYQKLSRITAVNDKNALYLPFDYSVQLKNYWNEKLIKLKLGGNMTGADLTNKIITTLYKNICAGDSTIYLNKILNIQYIILDKNPASYQSHALADCVVESYYKTPYIWGRYDFFNKLFASNKIYYEDDEFKIYELNNKSIDSVDFKPHIYTTKEKETIYWDVPYEKVEFKQKNPTQYRISLKNVSLPIYLDFSESFHPDWKLRAGDFNWFRAIMEKSYFLPDDFHIKNNANLNSFKIDPEFVKQNYPGSYSENPDGSINLDLTLYFKSQGYFYLGLIISSATLVGCLGYLAYYFTRRNKKVSKGEEKLAKTK